MEIKIGAGLDNLIFGMTQDQVKSMLGEPNKICTALDFDDVYFFFNKEMIITKFDEEEKFKLFTIEVHNPKVIMFNQRIINKSKKKIKSLLIEMGFDKFEYEEYTYFDTLSVEELHTTFSFEFDRLKSFEFSPLWKNENELIWPNL